MFVIMAHRLGAALCTGCRFESWPSEALKKGVLPFFYRVYPVRYPVPQHEEKVGQPKRSVEDETKKMTTNICTSIRLLVIPTQSKYKW